MSLREEQCKKVCRILDDVLANRPTERDSLIVAVRKAFKALAQPERVWSELDKQLIDALLRKIYELQGTSLSMDGVVAKKYYIEELYGVLFGRGDKPKWMT